jgi:hypothetical protein
LLAATFFPATFRAVSACDQEGWAMKFCGMNIKTADIESVTFKRDGRSITIYAQDETSPKIEGFSRKPEPPKVQLLRSDQRPPRGGHDGT